MSRSTTKMDWRWIIFILLHGILAAQTRKRTLKDEKYVLAKLDARFKMQLGHYKDNPEYTDHFTEWRLFRHSGKPLAAKVLIADKFIAYDNLRLDLEQLMEARVSELDFKMKRLPSNHKCMRFYLKQKLELERAYTRTNEVKQKVIRKNTNPCPFEPSVQRAIQIIDKNTNSSSHVQIHNNGSKDYNARKVIIAKIDAQINSKLGHYEDNKEYSEKLSKLIRAKKSGSANIELLYLHAKFQEYNSQRLNLEEKIDDRLSDITFVVKALAKPHKCVKFYSHQSWALKRVYQRENSVKIKVLRANSVKCPYECDPHNQNRTTIAPQ